MREDETKHHGRMQSKGGASREGDSPREPNSARRDRLREARGGGALRQVNRALHLQAARSGWPDEQQGEELGAAQTAQLGQGVRLTQ